MLLEKQKHIWEKWNLRPTLHQIQKLYTGELQIYMWKANNKAFGSFTGDYLYDLRTGKNFKRGGEGGRWNTKKKMHKSDKLKICDLNYYTTLFSPKEGTLAELPVT